MSILIFSPFANFGKQSLANAIMIETLQEPRQTQWDENIPKGAC